MRLLIPRELTDKLGEDEVFRRCCVAVSKLRADSGYRPAGGWDRKATALYGRVKRRDLGKALRHVARTDMDYLERA